MAQPAKNPIDLNMLDTNITKIGQEAQSGNLNSTSFDFSIQP